MDRIEEVIALRDHEFAAARICGVACFSAVFSHSSKRVGNANVCSMQPALGFASGDEKAK